MKFRFVGTWDATARVLRLARCTWNRGTVGDGKGYSAQFTFALTPRLFSVYREWQSLIVTILGLRLHYKRSFGGIFAP